MRQWKKSSENRFIFCKREKFTPFEAIAERIVLARAEPYEELKAWELKNV